MSHNHTSTLRAGSNENMSLLQINAKWQHIETVMSQIPTGMAQKS